MGSTPTWATEGVESGGLRVESREREEVSTFELPALDSPLLTHERPRGAARSARHPVKVEAIGSNPIGDAVGVEGEESRVEGQQVSVLHPQPSTLNPPLSTLDPARYANWQSGEAQTFVIVCGFDSHPCYLNNMRRLGIGEPNCL